MEELLPMPLRPDIIPIFKEQSFRYIGNDGHAYILKLLGGLCDYAILEIRSIGHGHLPDRDDGPDASDAIAAHDHFQKHAHLNTHFSMILPYIAFQTPIAVFILSGFMKSIPAEIEESAVVDGAGVFKISAASFFRFPFLQ